MCILLVEQINLEFETYLRLIWIYCIWMDQHIWTHHIFDHLGLGYNALGYTHWDIRVGIYALGLWQIYIRLCSFHCFRHHLVVTSLNLRIVLLVVPGVHSSTAAISWLGQLCKLVQTKLHWNTHHTMHWKCNCQVQSWRSWVEYIGWCLLICLCTSTSC